MLEKFNFLILNYIFGILLVIAFRFRQKTNIFRTLLGCYSIMNVNLKWEFHYEIIFNVNNSVIILRYNSVIYGRNREEKNEI